MIIYFQVIVDLYVLLINILNNFNVSGASSFKDDADPVAPSSSSCKRLSAGENKPPMA